SHPSVWAGRLVPLPAILPSPWPQNPVPNTPPTAEHPPTASPLPDMSYLGPPEALREADGHITFIPSDGFHPAARESSPLSQLWLAHACIHENTFHDYAQLLLSLCLNRLRRRSLKSKGICRRAEPRMLRGQTHSAWHFPCTNPHSARSADQ